MSLARDLGPVAAATLLLSGLFIVMYRVVVKPATETLTALLANLAASSRSNEAAAELSRQSSAIGLEIVKRLESMHVQQREFFAAIIERTKG